MASRKLIVEIVGDASSLQRSFRTSSAGAARFGSASKQAERDFSRASRGILSGSGVFRSLGRSLAFASGGFLAFGSAAAFLRSSVDAAREAAVANRQLAAQLKTTGQGFAAVKSQVDESVQSLSALSGFNATELTGSLTTILRGTKDLSRAEKLNALAADIARGRHISLAQAAIALGKAAAGSTTSLRRLGIQLPKGATGAEAIAIAFKRFAGQAQAGSTVAERFGAVLHNSEVIIGDALLPTLNKYLISGGRWLQQMNETGRLQRDVAQAVKTAGDVISGIRTAIQPVIGAMRLLDHVTGGTKNTIELLGGAFLILKTRAQISALSTVASSIFGIGTSAALATGEVEGLAGALMGLGGIGPIVIPILLLTTTKPGQQQTSSDTSAARRLFHDLFPGGSINLGAGFDKKTARDASTLLFGPVITGALFGKKGRPQGPTVSLSQVPGLPSTQDLNKAFAQINKQVRSATDKAGKPLSLLGQFNLLELKLADAQRAQNTVLQRAVLVSEENILVKLRDQAKTLKDRTKYAQQAASVEDQIVGMDKTASDAAKKTADARKRAAEAARQAAATYTTPLKLQLELVRAQALNKPVASILRKIIATAKQALASGKKSAQGQIDAWQTIIDANNQLANQAANALGKFKQASTAALVAGLHLSREDERRLRARLSQLGPGGTVPGGGVGAFGMPFNQQGNVIVNVTLDGKKVEKSVTKHQQKRRRRDSGQRRGPFAGGYGY